MNATARALTHGPLVSDNPLTALLPRSHKVLVLFVAVLLTALSVVYLKDLNRRLFINYQNLQQVGIQANTAHGELLLEESAWSTQARVQRIAVQRLGMDVPTTKKNCYGATLVSYEV